jgi:hypothetical protein
MRDAGLLRELSAVEVAGESVMESSMGRRVASSRACAAVAVVVVVAGFKMFEKECSMIYMHKTISIAE